VYTSPASTTMMKLGVAALSTVLLAFLQLLLQLPVADGFVVDLSVANRNRRVPSSSSSSSWSSVVVLEATTTKQSQHQPAGSPSSSSSSSAASNKIPLASDPTMIRNFAVVGHSHSGKTTLVESMMTTSTWSASTSKRGSSGSDSSSILDTDEVERTRHSSVFSHYVRVQHGPGDKRFVLEIADTPWGDFPADALSSLDGSDAALLTVSGPDGVQAGTLSSLRHNCKDASIPTMVVLTKMDRPFVDVDSLLRELETQLLLSGDADSGSTAAKPVPLQVPVWEGTEFRGVKSLFVLDDEDGTSGDAAACIIRKNPAVDRDDELRRAWNVLEEAVATIDDDLLVEYLENGELTSDRVLDGLHSAVVAGKILPVSFASSLTSTSTTEQLMDAVVAALPDPVSARIDALRAVCENDRGKCGMEPGVEAGFAARVLHTSVDSFGSVSVLRIVTNDRVDEDDCGNGRRQFKALPHEAVVLRTGERIKLPSTAACFGLNGKDRVPLGDGAAQLLPGDVVAVPKLPETVQTNDILVVPEAVPEDESEIAMETATHHFTPLSRAIEDIPLMAAATVSIPESTADNKKKGKRGGSSSSPGGKSSRGGRSSSGDEKIYAALRAMSRYVLPYYSRAIQLWEACCSVLTNCSFLQSN